MSGSVRPWDGQSARYWAHNELVARMLHRQLTPLFAQVVGIDPVTRDITRYVQSAGEGVVFCGTRYPHFRERQPEGRVSTCVFFHYVPADFAGPLE